MQETRFRPKISFLAKEQTICPICGSRFFREALLSGGGRLSADKVSDTLHRLFKPSQKFGKIYPLIYSIIVCPDCFFSSMPGDFTSIPPEKIKELEYLKNERIDFVNKLIGEPIDFNKYRTLESGAAGYALAVICYDFFTRKSIPVIKQAICSIRTAYLFEDLNLERPNENFKFLVDLFYKKALFFYKRAIELNQNKDQVMEVLKHLGPDIDKNYGYDGILYIVSILTYKFGLKKDIQFRRKDLDEARLYLGKLFGLGKIDYEKPKEILQKSKDFHELISTEIKEIDEKTQY